jgi:hypothetical protein
MLRLSHDCDLPSPSQFIVHSSYHSKSHGYSEIATSPATKPHKYKVTFLTSLIVWFLSAFQLPRSTTVYCTRSITRPMRTATSNILRSRINAELLKCWMIRSSDENECRFQKLIKVSGHGVLRDIVLLFTSDQKEKPQSVGLVRVAHFSMWRVLAVPITSV